MRTILKTSVLGTCRNTPRDVLVMVSYNNRFLRESGEYHERSVTAQEADILRFEQTRGFSNDCLVLFYTDETPEQLQAELEAMKPGEKMAHLFMRCPNQKNQFIAQSFSKQIMIDFEALLSERPLTSLSNQAMAYRLAMDSSVRMLMDSAQLRQFDDLINHCRGKIKEATEPSAMSKKVSKAFFEMGGGF